MYTLKICMLKLFLSVMVLGSRAFGLDEVVSVSNISVW